VLSVGCRVEVLSLVGGASFCGIFDVRINQQQAFFTMDVLDGDLKAAEASGFR